MYSLSKVRIWKILNELGAYSYRLISLLAQQAVELKDFCVVNLYHKPLKGLANIPGIHKMSGFDVFYVI